MVPLGEDQVLSKQLQHHTLLAVKVTHEAAECWFSWSLLARVTLGWFRVCSSVLAFWGISNCSCSVLGPSRLPYTLGDRIRPGKAKNRSRMMLFSSFLLHLMRFKTKAQIRNSRLSLFGEFSD